VNYLRLPTEASCCEGKGLKPESHLIADRVGSGSFGRFSRAAVLRGSSRPLVPKPGGYGRPSRSPDGRRLAMEVTDGLGQDIWVYDLERAPRG
jgi:hypothetical protein